MATEVALTELERGEACIRRPGDGVTAPTGLVPVESRVESRESRAGRGAERRSRSVDGVTAPTGLVLVERKIGGLAPCSVDGVTAPTGLAPVERKIGGLRIDLYADRPTGSTQV